jgi:hypothetical protein
MHVFFSLAFSDHTVFKRCWHLEHRVNEKKDYTQNNSVAQDTHSCTRRVNIMIREFRRHEIKTFSKNENIHAVQYKKVYQ